MKTKKVCAVPSCHDDVYCSGLCAKHYAYSYYWHRQGLAPAMRHRAKLEQRQECLDVTMTPSNVSHLRRERRAAGGRTVQ